MANNITEAELNQAIAALQDKGIPDDQIASVLQAMSFGEQPKQKPDNKGQGSNLGRDALAISMMGAGNPLMAALTAASRQPAMSQSDGITIAESKPDAPGTYVSAEQKQQDAYSQGITAQQVQMTAGMQSDPYYFLRTPDLNIPAQVASTNPNYRVEEPRTTTVDARGNIVIY